MDNVIKSLMMKATEASRLEKSIDQNPHDIESRLRLLLYYESRPVKNKKLIDSYYQHIFWLTANDPSNQVHETSVAATLLLQYAPQLIRSLKLEWFRQVRANPDSITILSHCARFCSALPNSLRSAAFIWEKALLIDQHNYKVLEGLCLTYTWLAYSGSAGKRCFYATKAIHVGLKAVSVNEHLLKSSNFAGLMIDQLLELAEQYELSDEGKILAKVRYANLN